MIPCALIGYFLARNTRDLAYSSNVGRRLEVFSLQPSQKLKDVRARLGITTRDVSELSQKIADHEGNSEFHISNAWLTQIENSDSVPSIFKLYSLSAIYRIKFTDILFLYGVDLANLAKHQLTAP